MEVSRRNKCEMLGTQEIDIPGKTGFAKDISRGFLQIGVAFWQGKPYGESLFFTGTLL